MLCYSAHLSTKLVLFYFPRDKCCLSIKGTISVANCSKNKSDTHLRPITWEMEAIRRPASIWCRPCILHYLKILLLNSFFLGFNCEIIVKVCEFSSGGSVVWLITNLTRWMGFWHFFRTELDISTSFICTTLAHQTVLILYISYQSFQLSYLLKACRFK